MNTKLKTILAAGFVAASTLFANAQQAPAALPPLGTPDPAQFAPTTLPTRPPTGDENCYVVRGAVSATDADLITLTLPLDRHGRTYTGPGKVVIFGVTEDRVRAYRSGNKLGYCTRTRAIDYFTDAVNGVVVVAIARAQGPLHLRTIFGGDQLDLQNVNGATATAVRMPAFKVTRR